jgi:hypothetical protein
MVGIVLGVMGAVLAYGVVSHSRTRVSSSGTNAQTEKNAIDIPLLKSTPTPSSAAKSETESVDCKRFKRESFCPMNYSPSTCSVLVKAQNGTGEETISSSGSNSCNASILLKEKICLKFATSQNSFPSLESLKIECKKAED